MGKEIIWTPRAEKTFLSVLEYLKTKWTEKEVLFFIERTNTIINYISSDSRIFRKSVKMGFHEALITKHNLLIYKIYPKSIYLITFWDTRQNPKRKFKI